MISHKSSFYLHHLTFLPIQLLFTPSGVVLKSEVGERLEIEVEIVAKSAILQEFCIVWALLFLKLLNVKIEQKN